MKRDRSAGCTHRTAMGIAFVAGAYSHLGRSGDAYIEVMQLATWLYIHHGAQAGAAS